MFIFIFIYIILYYFQPGQSERELNPYWKNGGTGLPPPKSLSSHKGFLKPKVDDDGDDYNYNSHQHTKSSYSRQSWKKPDRRDDYKNDIKKQDDEERHKRHRDYDEKRKEERYKRLNEYNNERKGERDKRHREHEDERKGDKDKRYREYDHKKEIKSKHCRKSEEKHKPVDEKYKEKKLEHNTYLDNSEEPEEHFETPLTDSELNALAAKQIKAELMGNTVSNLFNNYITYFLSAVSF